MSKSDCLGFKFRFSVTVLNYFKINKSHYLNTLTLIFMLCNQYTHADDAAEDCKCTPTSTSTDLRTALVKGRDTKTPKSKSWKNGKMDSSPHPSTTAYRPDIYIADIGKFISYISCYFFIIFLLLFYFCICANKRIIFQSLYRVLRRTATQNYASYNSFVD